MPSAPSRTPSFRYQHHFRAHRHGRAVAPAEFGRAAVVGVTFVGGPILFAAAVTWRQMPRISSSSASRFRTSIWTIDAAALAAVLVAAPSCLHADLSYREAPLPPARRQLAPCSDRIADKSSGPFHAAGEASRAAIRRSERHQYGSIDKYVSLPTTLPCSPRVKQCRMTCCA